MKRKIALGLLFAFLLTSCGSKPDSPDPVIPTYTITINETSHFTPSETTITFKENDFKPINISYSVDEGYFVTKTKIENSSLSECTFDEVNKNIIVTPKENVDFNVTVSVTEAGMRTAILITSDDDSHFHPETRAVSHAYNDPDPVVIRYQTDNHCSVSGVTVEPSGKATCDYTNNKLTIMPEQGTPFVKINVSITIEYKVINFVCDSEKGEELWPGAKSTLEIPYFSEWGEKVDLLTQRATYEFFDFVGWSFDKKEVIPNDYVINDDTPTTVYPVFIYDVDIVSESLEVHDVFIDEETDNLNIYLRLKNRDKYEYPTSKDKFIITNGFTTPVDNFEIEYSPDDDILAIVIPSSEFEILEQGVVSISVTDYQPEYDVAFIGEPNQHLSFPGLEEKKAKKGEDFSFKIEAVNETNAAIYYVPYQLDITIGDYHLTPDDYSIVPFSDERQEATVTIFAKCVRDEIKINGKAGDIHYCYYDFNGYGGIELVGRDPSGYFDFTQEQVFELGGSQGIQASDIAININNDDFRWYSLDALPEPYSEFISYDDFWQKITFEPDVSSTKPIKSISIHVCSAGYSIFKNATFNQINVLANSGLADRFFEVGEERFLQIDTCNLYHLRIVGINQDYLDDDETETVGLTIEFEEVITIPLAFHGDEPKPYLDQYASVPHNYFHDQTYNRYLNNTFYDYLPDELTMCFKEVFKKEYIDDGSSRIDTYKTKLFPFALSEIGLDDEYYEHSEGEIYQYYEDDSDHQKVLKCTINSSALIKPIKYWTRSAHQAHTRKYSHYIKENGEADFKNCSSDLAYMAAFCI